MANPPVTARSARKFVFEKIIGIMVQHEGRIFDMDLEIDFSLGIATSCDSRAIPIVESV